MRNDNDLKELRITNINSTNNRIKNIFNIIYFVTLLFLFSWLNIVFESNELENEIEKYNQATKIEELEPWYDYLIEISKCFTSYYLYIKSDKVIINKDELNEYISYSKAQNEAALKDVFKRTEKQFPASELEVLLNSEKLWQDVTYIASNDTLVSFLFSIDYYIISYFIERNFSYSFDSLGDFYTKYKSFNSRTDSMLTHLHYQIDSLKNPLEMTVDWGKNYLHEGSGALDVKFGYNITPFDNLPYFSISELLYKMILTHNITKFKKILIQNKELFDHVKDDLNSIALLHPPSDSSFSHYNNYYKLYPLEFIINSELPHLINLPTNIIISTINNNSLLYKNRYYKWDNSLLIEYYPVYNEVIEQYEIDNLKSIYAFKEMLTRMRGYSIQNLQAFGLEISTRAIFYSLPLIIIALYLFIMLLFHHLNTLLDLDKFSNSDDIKAELIRAPIIFLNRSIVWCYLLAFLPLLALFLIFVDQIIIHLFREIVINFIFSLAIVISIITLLILFIIMIRKLKLNSVNA